MKQIHLPCHGIVVILGEPDPDRPGSFLGGTIKSRDLHDPKESPDVERYNAAVDALESFILAAACVGIDVTAPAFVAAVETTVEAISNNLM